MDKREIKSKVKKRIITWIVMAVIAIGIVVISGNIGSKSQIMDNLDYNITLNEDGSAVIVETWDIYISHTNTIFKTFNLSNKFGEITNVKVKDLDSGKDLKQIYEEMYHVTTDCYYGLITKPGTFEIAWGTGMENKMGKKKYQITYTVTNAVTSYKDCQ